VLFLLWMIWILKMYNLSLIVVNLLNCIDNRLILLLMALLFIFWLECILVLFWLKESFVVIMILHLLLCIFLIVSHLFILMITLIVLFLQILNLNVLLFVLIIQLKSMVISYLKKIVVFVGLLFSKDLFKIIKEALLYYKLNNLLKVILQKLKIL
jgi:hypothetical protein